MAAMTRMNRFLRSSARIAKRQGLKLSFFTRDLGDLFHVYGKRATPQQFVALLKARNRLAPAAS